MDKTLLQEAAFAIRSQQADVIAAFAEELSANQPQWCAVEQRRDLENAFEATVDMLCDCMERDSLLPLQEYFSTAAVQTIQRGVSLDEMLEGILLGKIFFSDVIRNKITSPELQHNVLGALEKFYVRVIKQTGKTYSELLIKEQKAEHERTSLLLKATKTITHFEDPYEALERLLGIIRDIVPEGFVIFFLLNPETEGFVPHTYIGNFTAEQQQCVEALRLCTREGVLPAVDGSRLGLCGLNADSSQFSQQILDRSSYGSAALFPIRGSKGTLSGAALVGTSSLELLLDENQKTLIEGVLNTAAATIAQAAALREKERQLQESESLRRVANLLLQRPTKDVGDIHTVICDEARRIVKGTGSAILIQEGDALVHTCGTGTPQPPIKIFPIASTKYGEILRKGESVIIFDAQNEIPQSQRSQGVRTLLVVPLVESNQPIGLLLISNKKSGFDLEDKNIMELFASQATMALRNATLVAQSDKLAVARERQRLGRDLHDSVTQALYAVTLYASATKRSIHHGQVSAASEQLEALEIMAQQAMRDMRTLIFDLHPPELEDAGLVEAIRSRINSVEIRAGLITDITVDGLERRLPLTIEEEMFRIAIEALSNATRYSQARRVSVKVSYEAKQVSMTVTDDGKGFDITQLKKGGMGLRNIRERAVKLNAVLTINSEPHEGTTVCVVVPTNS